MALEKRGARMCEALMRSGAEDLEDRSFEGGHGLVNSAKEKSSESHMARHLFQSSFVWM